MPVPDDEDAPAMPLAVAGRRGSALPTASWAVTATLISIHVWLHSVGESSSPLAVADLGGMVPSLVWHGEWFRLVTASLLETSVWSLLGESICLVLVGGFLERLVGPRRLILLLMGSGFAGQLVASFWPDLGHLVRSGPGPAIFGLLGAASVISNRFARKTPFQHENFTMRLGFFVAITTLVHGARGDWIGTIAGFLAGLLGGTLLCRGRTEPAALRERHWLTNEALLAASAVFAIGLGADVMHVLNPASRLADRLVIADYLAAHPEADAKGVADFVQAVANQPDAPPVSLRRAVIGLASRSCASGGIIARLAASPDDGAGAQAYSEGDTDVPPPDLAAALIWPPDPIPPYFGKLLESLGRQAGPAILGDGAGIAVPAIRLVGGVIAIEAPSTADRGARLYALVRDGQGAISGMLFIMLPPGFSGRQILPIPTSFGAPSTFPPPPLWMDNATRLQVAVLDRRPCNNRGQVMGPSFYPMPQALTP